MASKTGGRRWFALAGVAAGIATTVRPAAIVAVVLPLALAAFQKKWRISAEILGLFLMIVVAERFYSVSVHGKELSSLVPRHIFAKAALIDAPPVNRHGYSQIENRFADMLEGDYRPVRALLKKTEGTPVHTSLLADYEVCIQWACLDATGLGEHRFDKARERVSIDRIAGNVPAYLRLSWNEYQGLWTLGSRTHPSLAPSYDAFVARERPMPLERQYRLTGALNPTVPHRSAVVIRPIFIALSYIVFMIFVLGMVFRRNSVLFVAGLTAMGIEISFAFVSITAVGYGRYTMSMWPNLVMALILFASVLIEIINNRIAPVKAYRWAFAGAPVTLQERL